MAKVAVIKDIHLINHYNKVNRVHAKMEKDPSGDLRTTTYLAIGTELSYVQCWFKRGICTLVAFDLEDIYNAYGTNGEAFKKSLTDSAKNILITKTEAMQLSLSIAKSS